MANLIFLLVPTISLNSRLVYPAAYLIFLLGCLIGIQDWIHSESNSRIWILCTPFKYVLPKYPLSLVSTLLYYSFSPVLEFSRETEENMLYISVYFFIVLIINIM